MPRLINVRSFQRDKWLFFGKQACRFCMTFIVSRINDHRKTELMKIIISVTSRAWYARNKRTQCHLKMTAFIMKRALNCFLWSMVCFTVCFLPMLSALTNHGWTVQINTSSLGGTAKNHDALEPITSRGHGDPIFFPYFFKYFLAMNTQEKSLEISVSNPIPKESTRYRYPSKADNEQFSSTSEVLLCEKFHKRFKDWTYSWQLCHLVHVIYFSCINNTLNWKNIVLLLKVVNKNNCSNSAKNFIGVFRSSCRYLSRSSSKIDWIQAGSPRPFLLVSVVALIVCPNHCT